MDRAFSLFPQVVPGGMSSAIHPNLPTIAAWQMLEWTHLATTNRPLSAVASEEPTPDA